MSKLADFWLQGLLVRIQPSAILIKNLFCKLLKNVLIVKIVSHVWPRRWTFFPVWPVLLECDCCEIFKLYTWHFSFIRYVFIPLSPSFLTISLSLFIPLSFVQFNITEMGNFITTCCVPCPWVKEICLHKSFKLSKWRSNTIFSKKLNSFYCKNIHTTKSCFNCNYVGLSNYQLQQFYYTVLVQLTYNRNCRHEIT